MWRYFGPGAGHGQLAIWWQGQYVSPPPAYPALVSDDGWRIKGVGDFDANGRSDILWQYAGQMNHGQLAVWWNGQNLSPAPWYPGLVSDDNWVIKGIEDFDRDSRSDVLWQFVGPSGQTTHGQLAIWFRGQSTNPVPAYPAVVGDNLVFQATGTSGL
ncbi:MAG: FG-GAP repeat domain-containing protein [Acidimicrobiia bacterium]